MKREELSEVISGIDPRFILEAETYSWKKRRLERFGRGGAVIAAMVCLAVLLHTLLPQESAGVFTVKAYALDLDESGMVVLREEDLLGKSDYWGGYCDGENYYINMGLRYEGENIESVTFTTEEGFFAQQRITPGMSEEDVSAIYAGPEKQLVVFGEEFTACGSSVTLEGAEMEEGLLLFWGVQALSTDDIPKNPKITAEAVFRDGGTQTVDVHLDLSGMSVFGGDIQTDDRDGMPVAYHQSQYYKKLPLEECELVDEQTVTDLYEYTVDDYTLSIQVPDQESFDENGQYRVRRQRISGSFYLLVFQMEEDACVARLYKVPRELEYSRENEAKQQAEQEGPSIPDADLPEEPATEESQTAESPELQNVKTPALQAAPEPPDPAPSRKEPASQSQETGNGGFTVKAGKATPEQLRRFQESAKYYSETLSLSDCELIREESVTDKFVFSFNGGTGVVYPEDVKELFDAEGYFRSTRSSGQDGTFLAVLYRDPQGDLWGQIYRVPEELVYPE